MRRHPADTVTCFNVNFNPFTFEEDNQIETTVLGYPLVQNDKIETLIVPDKEQLGLSNIEIENAFLGNKSLVISPGEPMKKDAKDNLIAITNPAAPRLSGSPFLLNYEVIGSLIGSVPLISHIHAVKIACLAKTNINAAIKYIKEKQLEIAFTYPSHRDLISDFQDEEALRIYKEMLILLSERLFNNAYKEYYSKNINAPRYNICLAASSRYFKSAILLAKTIERIHQKFDSMDHFFEALKVASVFKLADKESFNFLTAVLDDSFEDIFAITMETYVKEETERNIAFIEEEIKHPEIYHCSGKKGERLVKLPGSINELDLLLDNLENCSVFLIDHFVKGQCRHLINCKLHMGIITGYCELTDCRNCTVVASCEKLILTNCDNMIISGEFGEFLFTKNNCQNISLNFIIERKFQPVNLQDRLPKAYNNKVDAAIRNFFKQVVGLIDDDLNKATSEDKAFYLNRKGDYHNFIFNITEGREREESLELAQYFYQQAKDIAKIL